MITTPIVMRKSDEIDDWYMIEHKEHDRRVWWESVDEYSSYLRDTARVSDATVEGTSEEMRELAKTILANVGPGRKRGSLMGVHFKRCAVDCYGDHVELYSPRNSTKPGRISMPVAESLAKQILSDLREG